MPYRNPAWALWAWGRRITVFALGVLSMLDGLFGTHDSVAQLVIGMVLVGVLPLEDVLVAARRVHIDSQPKDEDDAR